eukprot:scaffold301_cov393-Prasinococcus_capsulatus_cf.AAC.15
MQSTNGNQSWMPVRRRRGSSRPPTLRDWQSAAGGSVRRHHRSWPHNSVPRTCPVLADCENLTQLQDTGRRSRRRREAEAFQTLSYHKRRHVVAGSGATLSATLLRCSAGLSAWGAVLSRHERDRWRRCETAWNKTADSKRLFRDLLLHRPSHAASASSRQAKATLAFPQYRPIRVCSASKAWSRSYQGRICGLLEEPGVHGCGCCPRRRVEHLPAAFCR